MHGGWDLCPVRARGLRTRHRRLAYVKSADDELLQDKGATTKVPLPLLTEVVDSAKECPGDCIHVRRAADKVEVYGPDAE